MKRKYNSVTGKAVLLLCLLTLGITNSCKEDFLDVDPQGQARGEDFFVTPEHAIRSVNAIYGNLDEWGQAGFPTLALATISSDDADKGSVEGDAGFLNDFDQFTFTATQFVINDYWTYHYQGINLANQTINRVPPIQMDEALKARLIGEAKFLRAFHYFNLVRAFGGVPLRITIPADPNKQESPEEVNLPRASREEVYAQIEADLNDAIQVLPVRYDAENVGRATKGAALTLLAKVNMYEKKWNDVLSLTQQVMGLGYALMPDYNAIFRIPNENNIESVFEIQAQSLPGNCDASNSQWSEVRGVRPQFGWGFGIPSEDLEKAYEPGDVRKDATILYRGEVTPEGDKISESAANPRYNQKAYTPGNVTKECGYGRDQNIRVLRFAEVLLMNAEAANELGMPDMALSSLNRVRERAGLKPVTTTSQEEMRNIIWHERRVELALEDDRFFDLVRQSRAGEVLRALGKKFVDGKNEVFPIPQRQIDLSGGVLTQNPGY